MLMHLPHPCRRRPSICHVQRSEASLAEVDVPPVLNTLYGTSAGMPLDWMTD